MRVCICVRERESRDRRCRHREYAVVTIFGYGVNPSEMNKPKMCNIAHVLANKPKA